MQALEWENRELNAQCKSYELGMKLLYQILGVLDNVSSIDKSKLSVGDHQLLSRVMEDLKVVEKNIESRNKTYLPSQMQSSSPL